MKKIVYIFMFVFMIILLSACGTKEKDEQISAHTQEIPTPLKVETSISTIPPSTPAIPAPLEEEKIEKFVSDSSERTIAIMIDNDNPDAWPHAGLEDAYIIYEMIVEGGATRFMALYKDKDTAKIGPIRSSRHYFLDYVMENDTVYIHYGWSPQAAKDLLRLKLDKINGVLGSEDWIFWREPKHKWDYHDVYTSIENIKEIMKQKGYRETSDIKNFSYVNNELTLNDGQTAKKITIPYSIYYKTYYEYDDETKLYKRWMREKPHMLSTSEQQMSTKNIIIQFVKNYYLNDGEPKVGRQQLDTVGNGKGFYITNGKVIPITWKKENRKSKTFYIDEQGNEIQLNDGQTWIQITPINAKVKIE